MSAPRTPMAAGAHHLVAATALALLAQLALACGVETPVPTERPRQALRLPAAPWHEEPDRWPARRPEPARGAEPYQRFCATCHGEDGAGQTEVGLALAPPPTDFTDHAYMLEQTPEWYHRSLVQGVAGSSMQPWDHVLDEDGLWDVAFYVWLISTPAESLARGAEGYARHCLECHGSDGAGVAERRFDDPSRVAGSRAQELRGLAAAHPELAARLEPGLLEDIVQHSWTYLYRLDPVAAATP